MSQPTFPHTTGGIKLMADHLQSRLLADDIVRYQSNDLLIPVIYLAGAPGSGKTEWIESFPDRDKYVIIDIDLYRSLFEGYTGSNASHFHQYASRVMDRMYSFCIRNRCNMIVDGTFANIQKATENIGQCKKKQITFAIVLVMQDPIISYLYTKKREIEKLRNVPTNVFIDKFFRSIETVRHVLGTQNDNYQIIIATKDREGEKFHTLPVVDIKSFDNHTRNDYTPDILVREITRIDAELTHNSFDSLVGKQLQNNSTTSGNLPG